LNARDVGFIIICKITIGFPSFWASKLTLCLYFTWHELQRAPVPVWYLFVCSKNGIFQLVKKKYSHPHMLTYFTLCTTQIIQGHIRWFTGKPSIPGAGARLQVNISDPPPPQCNCNFRVELLHNRVELV
jgi:hypothetical protein